MKNKTVENEKFEKLSDFCKDIVDFVRKEKETTLDEIHDHIIQKHKASTHGLIGKKLNKLIKWGFIQKTERENLDTYVPVD